MEPIATLIVVLFIFGGALFIGLLLRFWIATIIRNARIRRSRRQILDRAVASFAEHYQNGHA